MNAEKAVEAVAWLKANAVWSIAQAIPVRVTLDKHKFYGARVSRNEVYTPTERAVDEGVAKAGEPYLVHAFYLLGKVPKFKAKVVFDWIHNLPIDSRVYRSFGEWYVGCYSNELNEHTPLGHNFLLFEWLSHAYGTYKDHKIDTLERYPYFRVPMTVECL